MSKSFRERVREVVTSFFDYYDLDKEIMEEVISKVPEQEHYSILELGTAIHSTIILVLEQNNVVNLSSVRGAVERARLWHEQRDRSGAS